PREDRLPTGADIATSSVGHKRWRPWSKIAPTPASPAKLRTTMTPEFRAVPRSESSEPVSHVRHLRMHAETPPQYWRRLRSSILAPMSAPRVRRERGEPA